MKLPRLAGAIFFVGLCATSSLHAQSLIEIGALGQNIITNPLAINNLGQVVGRTGPQLSQDGFLFSNGTMIDLGRGQADGINNSGQVVGLNFGNGAFLYSGGITTALVGLDNAEAINDAGLIAGISGTNAVLDSNGTVTTLTAPPGTTYSITTAINGSGNVVGYSLINGNTEAFLYSGGTWTDIGTGSAYGINDTNQIVGSAVGSGDGGSYLYSNGIRTNLGILGGNSVGQALGINDLGQVVGSSGSAGYIYTEGSGMQNLNTLYASLLVSGADSKNGFTHLNVANAINDSGDIVGTGMYWDGTTENYAGFLLEPAAVPEPQTWAQLVGGCGLLVLLRRCTNSSRLASYGDSRSLSSKRVSK